MVSNPKPPRAGDEPKQPAAPDEIWATWGENSRIAASDRPFKDAVRYVKAGGE